MSSFRFTQGIYRVSGGPRKWENVISYHWFETLYMAFTQHFVTFRMQITRKLFQKVRLNLTFLWLFIILFVLNFVFFEACLKLIPLFQRYMDMHPRVLYTKSNLSLCLFNMWNMSLICQPMPEIRGVSKNTWTSGHPVEQHAENHSIEPAAVMLIVQNKQRNLMVALVYFLQIW